MADSTNKQRKTRAPKVEALSSDTSSVSNVSVHEAEADDDESALIPIIPLPPLNVSINREEYLAAHRDLTFDRHRLQILNNILHRRLAEYYKKRKCTHVLKPVEVDAEMEEKYQQKLFVYGDLQLKVEKEIIDLKDSVTEIEAYYAERLEQTKNIFNNLQQLERSTGSGLIYSRKGKPMTDKTVERYLTLQRCNCEQSSELSLRYLLLRNSVAELETIVKKLECVSPGLYVYQYEQLNVENQTYITKIEERENELIKNRAKCTEHNQIIAHIKEKMHHTDDIIDIAECDLGDAEINFFKAREDLSTVKKYRNKLRRSVEEEIMKAGLLSRKDLLRDYQAAIEEVEMLALKKKSLENQVSKTNQELREARKRMSGRRRSSQQSQS